MDYSKITEKLVEKKSQKRKWFHKLFFKHKSSDDEKKLYYSSWVTEYEPEIDFLYRGILLEILKTYGWSLRDQKLSFKNFMLLIYKYGE